jgi:FAD synthase
MSSTNNFKIFPIPGKQLARTVGYPTYNFVMMDEHFPHSSFEGRYLAEVCANGSTCNALVSLVKTNSYYIGESHIFDFNDKIETFIILNLTKLMQASNALHVNDLSADIEVCQRLIAHC